MQLTLAIRLHLRLCPPKHTHQAYRLAGKVLPDKDGSILHDGLLTPAFALIDATIPPATSYCVHNTATTAYPNPYPF